MNGPTHSFTVNIALDDVLSLSASDDDVYDDDEKDAYAYHQLLPLEPKQPLQPLQPREPVLLLKKEIEPESKHDTDNDNDDDDDVKAEHADSDETDESENEQTTQETEDEESEEDYAKSLILDSDIAIARMLQRLTYKNISKLCATDQGSVWRARAPKKLGAQSVVIKVASKLHYKAEATTPHEDILKEISLLRRINELKEPISDGVIHVLDTLHTTEHYVAVLEDGGADLFSFITECHALLSTGTLTVSEWQKTVKLMAQRLVEVLHALHSTVRVCHGDISLENVLISNVKWIAYPDQYKRWKKRLSPDFKLKLIDFGAAIDCTCDGDSGADDKDEKEQFASTSAVGKAMYCSPQIYALQNKRSAQAFDGRATDVWSLGVCLFIMAVGCPPWTKPDEQGSKLFQTIVLGRDLDCVLKAWSRTQFVEEKLKELLLSIFVVDEARRVSTRDILRCEWLTGN